MDSTEVVKAGPGQPVDNVPDSEEQPVLGDKQVGAVGIVLLILYLIGLSILSICGLIRFLPEEVSAAGQSSQVSYIVFLFWSFSLNQEICLFITVALAGLLGSLVHALRSLYWYVGQRNLTRSWIPKYILLPIVGTVLALAFYLVIRGGFFSAGANVGQTNPYGFTALAVLIGMFSEQAALKLKSVAETLLSKPPQGSDASPQGEPEEPEKPDGAERKK